MKREQTRDGQLGIRHRELTVQNGIAKGTTKAADTAGERMTAAVPEEMIIIVIATLAETMSVTATADGAAAATPATANTHLVGTPVTTSRVHSDDETDEAIRTTKATRTRAEGLQRHHLQGHIQVRETGDMVAVGVVETAIENRTIIEEEILVVIAAHHHPHR